MSNGHLHHNRAWGPGSPADSGVGWRCVTLQTFALPSGQACFLQWALWAWSSPEALRDLNKTAKSKFMNLIVLPFPVCDVAACHCLA